MVTKRRLSDGQRALAEAWPELKALDVTEEKIRHAVSTEKGRAQLAAFFNSTWPLGKSAATPAVTKWIEDYKVWGHATVLEDVPSRFIRKPKFISFLEPGEEKISGEEMRKRSVKLGCDLGLADAVWLFSNKELIPKEFRNPYMYIIFPGTLLSISSHDTAVPYMYWEVGGAGYGYFSLRPGTINQDWGKGAHIIRCE